MATKGKVLVERSLITKSASAIRQAMKERAEAMEKAAARERAHDRFLSNMHRLHKLASSNLVAYESIPEYLEKLASMSESDQELELLALEKAASHDFLNLGDISNKPDSSGYGDPITDLVMGNIGV